MTAMHPQTYSFECPSCRSMLSLPVELEGVTGPCPHCQTVLTAPPVQFYIPEYTHAAVEAPVEPEFYQPQQEEPSALEQTQEWTQEQYDAYYAQAEAVNPPMTEQWMQQPYAEPQAPTPTWEQLTADHGTPHSIPLPVQRAESPALQETRLPSQFYPDGAPKGKSKLLVAGLVLALCGVGGGAYYLMNPPKVAVDNYIPPSRQPLSPEELAALNPAAPTQPTVQPAPPVAVDPPPTKPDEPAVAVTPVPPVNPPEPDPARPVVEMADPPPSTEINPQTPEVRPAKVVPAPEVAVPAEATPFAAPPGTTGGTTASVQLDESTLAEPRGALTQFLAAPNWKERAKFSQSAAENMKQMEEYYASHADGPVKVDSVDYLTSQPTPDGKGQFHLFQVHASDGIGFPVSVEKMDGSYKIDWRSFVEFKDLLLPRFFEKYSEEPATFHVVMRRSHYFGTDVPNQEGKICFAVEPPVAGYTNYVWVDKDNSDLLSKIGERAEWSNLSYPVIALRWVKEKDGAAYVTIFQIVADNWRSDFATKDPFGLPK